MDVSLYGTESTVETLSCRYPPHPHPPLQTLSSLPLSLLTTLDLCQTVREMSHFLLTF